MYFLFTSLLNTILGVTLATIIHPGDPNLVKNVVQDPRERKQSSALDSLLDLGRNILADNIFQATFEQVCNMSVFTFYL